LRGKREKHPLRKHRSPISTSTQYKSESIHVPPLNSMALSFNPFVAAVWILVRLIIFIELSQVPLSIVD